MLIVGEKKRAGEPLFCDVILPCQNRASMVNCVRLKNQWTAMCTAFVKICKCRACLSDVSSLFNRKGLKEDLPGHLSRLLLVAIENDDSFWRTCAGIA